MEENAIRTDGTIFTDKDVHRKQESRGYIRALDKDNKSTEWFKIDYKSYKEMGDLHCAITAVKNRETA